MKTATACCTIRLLLKRVSLAQLQKHTESQGAGIRRAVQGSLVRHLYTSKASSTRDINRTTMTANERTINRRNIINRYRTTIEDTRRASTQRPESADSTTFDNFYRELSSTLIQRSIDNFEVQDAIDRFKIVLDYNVPFGKKNRGLTVVASYRALARPEDLENEDCLKRVMAVGWCVELFQAFFLVADDIMDRSTTRRGQPCWYRMDKVGLAAINDASFIQECIFQTLRQYLRDQPYYLDIVELFHETIYQTIIGQSLDMLTAPEGERDLSRFTIDRYNAIVKWKTAFYSFYLPVALAMHMTGINDEKSHQVTKNILLQMGHYFQIQDDYLDCYGNAEITGKIGTDIQDNKCSWLVVQALQRANQQQRMVLQENYGYPDEKKVAEVKRIYEELNLKNLYLEFEEESYKTIMELVEHNHGKLHKQIFKDLMAKIYKRNK
ncbi:farnesyl pyrophosphate synthase-like [Ptychodera flava]|uniref:farnesyl pyrophosphate synthase-like n=1 Tax=Ptychodera flava TaxID=63121 RepID=UPI00396A8169